MASYPALSLAYPGVNERMSQSGGKTCDSRGERWAGMLSQNWNTGAELSPAQELSCDLSVEGQSWV